MATAARDGWVQRQMDLPLKRLVIDPSYQRDLVPWLIKSILSNFDPRAIGVFIVSQRDGVYRLLDGQQRAEVLRQKKYLDARVPCLVHFGLSQEEENELFVKLNFNAHLTALRHFNNAVQRGQDPQYAIRTLCDELGWRIGETDYAKAAPGMLVCVGTLVSCYENAVRTDRVSAYLDALSVILEVYRHEHAATTGTFIKIIYHFCRKYWGHYTRDRLTEILRELHPEEILRQARFPQPDRFSHVAARAFILRQYNQGLRGKRRLPEDVDADTAPEDEQ